MCFVFILFYFIYGLFFYNLHVKAFLKALVYIILCLDYNVMDVVNVVMFYLVIISDASCELLPGDSKDELNVLTGYMISDDDVYDYDEVDDNLVVVV